MAIELHLNQMAVKSGNEYVPVMAGSLVSHEEIAADVDTWLEDNITQETGYILDRSLTSSNAAAPADLVGDIKNSTDSLTDVSKLLELTWTKGSGVSAIDGTVSLNTNMAVTDFYTVESLCYIILKIGTGTTTSRYYQFVTYQSDGTFLTGEQVAFSTTPERVRVLKPGYKYRFGVTKPTAANINDVIAMVEFQRKHLDEDEKGLPTKVSEIQGRMHDLDALGYDVNGGGDQIHFVIEKGSISTSTGADSTSNINGRMVGYYAGDNNGLMIYAPVGGILIIYEYASESSAGFTSTIGPSGGVQYVNSPYTLQTETGKYYRFTYNLNNSASWEDPEEWFGGFKFVKASTYTPGLDSRVTALELASGSDKIFTGKTCVTLGDSITYRNVWQPIVNEALGMTMINKGIGSTTLSGGATDTAAMSSNTRLNGVLAESPDYVTILGGANDFPDVPIGTSAQFDLALADKDRSTFIGAYSYIVEYLLSNDPTLDIMLLGTTWAHSDGARYSETVTFTMYSDATKLVAKHYGLPFVDLHGECGFNQFTMGSARDNQIYSIDQIHPNEAGGKRIASLVIAKMLEAWKYTI